MWCVAHVCYADLVWVRIYPGGGSNRPFVIHPSTAEARIRRWVKGARRSGQGWRFCACAQNTTPSPLTRLPPHHVEHQKYTDRAAPLLGAAPCVPREAPFSVGDRRISAINPSDAREATRSTPPGLRPRGFFPRFLRLSGSSRPCLYLFSRSTYLPRCHLLPRVSSCMTISARSIVCLSRPEIADGPPLGTAPAGAKRALWGFYSPRR